LLLDFHGTKLFLKKTTKSLIDILASEQAAQSSDNKLQDRKFAPSLAGYQALVASYVYVDSERMKTAG